MSDQREARVSYIISTRNRAEYLDKALDNVREFITPDDELIVIDGGSTDHTAEVIEKHRDIVTLFRSEPDYGEAHGFNKGILESRGRYIKVLTDDDYFYPEAMHYAISVMENHLELDAIVCGGERCRFDPVADKVRLYGYRYLPLPCRVSVSTVLPYVGCGLGLVIRRRSIARVGLFDTTFLAVDAEYLIRLCTHQAQFKYLNVNLYRHVEYPHSGQLKKTRCERDKIRALLRSREWDKAMGYPCDDVKQVLGLNDLPGGDALAQIVWYAERWRRGRRLRLFLRPLALGLGGCLEIASWFGRLWRRVARGKVVINSPKAQPPAEPEWDGSLR